MIRMPTAVTQREWNGYTCYTTYLAMKAHFNRDSYDFFKYGGTTKAAVSTFEVRRDRYQFEKLSRAALPAEVMLAHLSANPDT